MPDNYHPDEVIHRSDKKSPRGILTAVDLYCAFVGRMCRNGYLAVDGCVFVLSWGIVTKNGSQDCFISVADNRTVHYVYVIELGIGLD